MDPKALLALAQQHKWFALAALVIGLVVRLLKSDGPIPINVPAKYRAWLAVGLGIVAGVLDMIGAGTAWKEALLGGILAAFAAISGHQLVVESLRSGREVGESKPAFRTRSTPPPAPPVVEEKKIDPPS